MLFAALLALGVGTEELRAEGDVEITHRIERMETFVNEDGAKETRMVAAKEVVEGDELRYTITFTNGTSETVAPNSVVLTNPIPESTEYIEGSAFGSGARVEFSVDGGENFGAPETLRVHGEDGPRLALPSDYTTIRWYYGPALLPGQQSHVFFRVRIL